MALSKAATRSRGKDGRMKKRKLMFIDAKKAHLNPRCDQEGFIELPEEAEFVGETALLWDSWNSSVRELVRRSHSQFWVVHGTERNSTARTRPCSSPPLANIPSGAN